MAWRDGLVRKQGALNRCLPVLSVVLKHAEMLGYRKRGSNPCKRVARYKRTMRESFLSLREYQRLGSALREKATAMPQSVPAIWLLLCTGARKGEIAGLRWEWIGERFIDLPDSKTGPKRLYLNRLATAVLDSLVRDTQGPLFGGMVLDRDWRQIRQDAGLGDVRLHDLRHSFAIARGVSLTKLGGLLGHALPETTVRYAHLADDSIQEAAHRVSGSIARVLGLAK